MNRIYLDTARLLTRVAPLVFVDDRLALKGGTAINLFIRDMPRLSVDLDLVFTDHTVRRQDALARINAAVSKGAERLRAQGLEVHVPAAGGDGETRLLIRRAATQVKVEINTVIRGTVHPVRQAALTKSARETLLSEIEIPVLALEDVYGGKLVAALDRQHPRDLFDVLGAKVGSLVRKMPEYVGHSLTEGTPEPFENVFQSPTIGTEKIAVDQDRGP